jgi:hypothetical protein
MGQQYFKIIKTTQQITAWFKKCQNWVTKGIEELGFFMMGNFLKKEMGLSCLLEELKT